jgi:hypothetical protein
LWREQPQIWLPFVPLHGRNANLYHNEWDELVRHIINFVRHVEERPAPRTPTPDP